MYGSVVLTEAPQLKDRPDPAGFSVEKHLVHEFVLVIYFCLDEPSLMPHVAHCIAPVHVVLFDRGHRLCWGKGRFACPIGSAFTAVIPIGSDRVPACIGRDADRQKQGCYE